jgi:hypothetical protein
VAILFVLHGGGGGRLRLAVSISRLRVLDVDKGGEKMLACFGRKMRGVPAPGLERERKIDR